MSEAVQLVRYDTMVHAIAAAYDVDEVKDIRDKAQAIEVYARQAKNTEAERQACEIRLRAERRWGQLRKDQVLPKGRPSKTSSPATLNRRSLSDLGVTRDQSSKWQKLAEIPDDDFESAVRDQGDKPSTNGVIAKAAPPATDKVDHEALWLWGRLQDFERDGLLDRDPIEMLSTMLPHMVVTTKRLAPLVAAWLERLS